MPSPESENYYKRLSCDALENKQASNPTNQSAIKQAAYCVAQQ